MCGIAGIHRRNGKNVPRIGVLMDELLFAIQNRGHDSAGIAVLEDNGSVKIEKRVGLVRELIAQRSKVKFDTRTILLHTRFATVGARNVTNAHPQGYGTIAVVHNGTIYNDSELFRTFMLKRRTSVDSEVIPAMVDLAGWRQLAKALELLEGGAAVALFDTKHPGELALARVATYSLHFIVTDEAVIWASTREAIKAAWKKTYGTKLKLKTTELNPGDLVRVIDGDIRFERFTPRKPSWTSYYSPAYSWRDQGDSDTPLHQRPLGSVTPQLTLPAGVTTAGELSRSLRRSQGKRVSHLPSIGGYDLQFDDDDGAMTLVEAIEDDEFGDWCADCGEWQSGLLKQFADESVCDGCWEYLADEGLVQA